jgi:hypothetical protein
MAKEKSLDLAAVQTWLAAWKEEDFYSDAAVRDLLSLIPDNDCMVVITCGVGCPPRSLVFRRWRRVVVLPAKPTIKAPVQILDPNRMTMFHGPTAPMAPTTGQLWLKEGETPKWSVPWVTQKIFCWDGTQWLLHGHLRDEAWIRMQGNRPMGPSGLIGSQTFAEALARAHWDAQRLNLETIYTFDDSTWGNA